MLSGTTHLRLFVFTIVLTISTTCQLGQISTVAGTGQYFENNDEGIATETALSFPCGLASDSFGNVLIADRVNDAIRNVSNGMITNVMVGLNGPFEVHVDWEGNIFVAETPNHCVKRLNNDGISVVAGQCGTSGSSGDGGSADDALLHNPTSVVVTRDGTLYIADRDNHRIRKVVDGIITTYAGSTPGFHDGLAQQAEFYQPYGLAVDSDDNLVIADYQNHRVRRIDRETEEVSTIAGTGVHESGTDGLALTTSIYGPVDVIFDENDVLYIAEHDGHKVRVVENGQMGTVAGTGADGYNGDNIPATTASLCYPWGLTFARGNLYIGDRYNHRVRMVRMVCKTNWDWQCGWKSV